MTAHGMVTGALVGLKADVLSGGLTLGGGLLAGGLIGVFIATRWTFAAEVGGCQAEGGSAASMAAVSRSWAKCSSKLSSG